MLTFTENTPAGRPTYYTCCDSCPEHDQLLGVIESLDGVYFFRPMGFMWNVGTFMKSEVFRGIAEKMDHLNADPMRPMPAFQVENNRKASADIRNDLLKLAHAEMIGEWTPETLPKQ